MKKKNLNFNSKLHLLKETITPLTNNQLSTVYGGEDTNRTAPQTTNQPLPSPTIPPPAPSPSPSPSPQPVPSPTTSGYTCTGIPR